MRGAYAATHRSPGKRNSAISFSVTDSSRQSASPRGAALRSPPSLARDATAGQDFDTAANGTAEREAAVATVENLPGARRVTVRGDFSLREPQPDVRLLVRPTIYLQPLPAQVACRK